YEYALLDLCCTFVKFVPARTDTLEVILIFENTFEELDLAFNKKICIYRDSLLLYPDDANKVVTYLASEFAEPRPANLPDLTVTLRIGEDLPIIMPLAKFDSEKHSLICTASNLGL